MAKGQGNHGKKADGKTNPGWIPEGQNRNTTGRHGPKDADGLTKYERRFVTEYLIDLNGCEALRRMGYKGNRITQDSYDLRHKPNMEIAIEAAFKRQQERLQVTAEQVIEQYRRIAFSNVQHYITIDADGNETIDLMGIPADRAETIASFEAEPVEVEIKNEDGTTSKRTVIGRVKVKTKDSLHALDKLGEHLGLFRPELTVTATVRFVIDHAPPGGQPVPPMIEINKDDR